MFSKLKLIGIGLSYIYQYDIFWTIQCSCMYQLKKKRRRRRKRKEKSHKRVTVVYYVTCAGMILVSSNTINSGSYKYIAFVVVYKLRLTNLRKRTKRKMS